MNWDQGKTRFSALNNRAIVQRNRRIFGMLNKQPGSNLIVYPDRLLKAAAIGASNCLAVLRMFLEFPIMVYFSN